MSGWLSGCMDALFCSGIHVNTTPPSYFAFVGVCVSVVVVVVDGEEEEGVEDGGSGGGFGYVFLAHMSPRLTNSLFSFESASARCAK